MSSYIGGMLYRIGREFFVLADCLYVSVQFAFYVLTGTVAVDELEEMLACTLECEDDLDQAGLCLWWSPSSASRIESMWVEMVEQEAQLAALRGE